MLDKAELAEFKQILQALQARVRGDVEQLTVGALDQNSGSADSKSPTHIAELGTEAYEQDFALRFVESDNGVLDEIENAITRINQGVYGVCEACNEAGKAPSRSMIPKTRLRAIPYTRNCVACERKREELTL